MDILQKLEDFYLKFRGEKGTIGKSIENRNIYYFCVKKTSKPIIICQYAIHGREYITTYLALKQIKNFRLNKNVGTVYFIPAVNPDGIYRSLYKNPLYKANARGVDLNVNFSARWGTGQKNVTIPSSENYIGEYPFSEKESIALRDFTLKIKPHLTLSYHSKGEEIYWEFFQPKKVRERDIKYASIISSITGYPLVECLNSAGGYKDWCIEKLKIPAVTIEVGNDNLTHPIKETELKTIYKQNKKVLTHLTKALWEDYNKK